MNDLQHIQSKNKRSNLNNFFFISLIALLFINFTNAKHASKNINNLENRFITTIESQKHKSTSTNKKSLQKKFRNNTKTATNHINQNTNYCIPEFFFASSQAGIVLNEISISGETKNWFVDPVLYSETGYADYTEAQSVDLLPGNTYTINFHTNWQMPNFINTRAWIDYNQNFQFDDDEEIGNNSNGINADGNGSFTFTIPENAEIGIYRLRTMLQYPNTQPENLNSCGTINSYGIAIDYNLEIIDPNSLIDSYCEVTVDYDVEPITLVNIADLNNETSALINGSPKYEDFTNLVANFTKNTQYNLTVKGNTNGNFEHDIRVFIDWNQDFTFDMENEFYTASLPTSTGLDEVQVTIPIQIPSTATLGNTRMRIIKDQWNIYEEGEFEACTNAYYGQIEDYTLNIQDESLVVKPFDKNEVVVYPNPSNGKFYLTTELSIDRLEIYNVAGQKIAIIKSKEIDLTQVVTGLYYLKVFTTNGSQNTYKLFKK